MNTQALRIERKPEVVNRVGLPTTTLQDRIYAGLFPRPINLGGRAVGWPAHEVDTMIAAMIAGRDADALRSLVKDLIERRQDLTALQV